MSNIILTTECPRKCKYCFAKDNDLNHMEFTMADFKKVVDWFIADETEYITRVGLLGGEPTAHPSFLQFLDYILSKQLSTIIFTNGMVKDISFYKELIKVAKKNKVRHSSDMGFCLNVNEHKYQTEEEEKLQSIFLYHLGRVTSFSFNIFEEDFDPSFLIYTIKKHNTIRHIRLGLAAPLGNKNVFLRAEQYRTVAKKIVSFAEETAKENIAIGFDCGFTRCMFTDDEIKILTNKKSNIISFDCGPSIDVYPDLKISSCYPLSNLKKLNMEDFTSYSEMYFYFKDEIGKLRTIHSSCNTCKHFLCHECDGGCRAHNING